MTLAHELVLDADVPGVDLGRLEVVDRRVQPRGRVGIARCRRAQVLERVPTADVEFEHAGGVGDHVEDHVALGPVVEDPGAAADDRLALARDVVGEAEAGRHPERVAVLQLVVDALAGLEGAVEPDVRQRGPGTRRPMKRPSTVSPGRGVHADAVGARARRGADARRDVEGRGVGWRRTGRAGSSTPAGSCPTAASCSRSARRSRGSAARWPSSCPGRTTRCSCSSTPAARTWWPACSC